MLLLLLLLLLLLVKRIIRVETLDLALDLIDFLFYLFSHLKVFSTDGFSL
jgi:hypothetical protein